MTPNVLIKKIEVLAIEATHKPWRDMSVMDVDLAYCNMQEIRDLISQFRHDQQTSGISKAGQEVLDTIRLVDALNRETML
jgi:hypothetical protein